MDDNMRIKFEKYLQDGIITYLKTQTKEFSCSTYLENKKAIIGEIISKNLFRPWELIKKYEKISKLSPSEIDIILGRNNGFYNRYKNENDEYNKEIICELSICFQLKKREIKEFLLSSQIKLEPLKEVYDTTFVYFTNNSCYLPNRKDTMDSFKEYLNYADNYVTMSLC